MKKNGFRISYIIIPLLFILLGAASWYYHDHHNKAVLATVDAYIKNSYKAERNFIENIPIYRDFATPKKEETLRKFLLKEHLAAAEKFGLPPVKDEKQIKKLSKEGKLVQLSPGKGKLYFFYNVRKKYRYLTPGALKGLEKITHRFRKNLNRKTDVPPVKLAISSVLRPQAYQGKLTKRNYNATVVSTHSCGISFDIFFDDYFVALPFPGESEKLAEDISNKLRTRFGFILGDSLRRQFRSVLMETLIQLQDEGRLYAILERRQRCYHVTILE
ncbi:MAG: hypothetical protein GY754_25220 [bacterium]|nr:hypothetical protein [bacterium]